MNRRRSLLVLLAVLVLGGAGATFVAAAPPDQTKTRTTGESLFAYSQESGVAVSMYRDFESGLYRVCVYTMMSSACTLVTESPVTIRGNLKAATLNLTAVFQVCPNDGTGYPMCTNEELTVVVAFEGTSDLIRGQTSYKFRDGCRYMFSEKTLSRTGEATITVEGQTYDAEGHLFVSSRVTREQC